MSFEYIEHSRLIHRRNQAGSRSTKAVGWKVFGDGRCHADASIAAIGQEAGAQQQWVGERLETEFVMQMHVNDNAGGFLCAPCLGFPVCSPARLRCQVELE